MELLWPTMELLVGYVNALERGWSANTMRPEATQEDLAEIGRDAAAFVGSLVDRDASGRSIVLPDGTSVPRLPGYSRWMWDGEFCGSINLRWQPGTSALPSHVLGHIGYSVVPWKQRRGYATKALGLLLVDAAGEGLERVELTTDLDNIASRRVIEANGGELEEQFLTDRAYDHSAKLRYAIALNPPNR